MKRLVPCLFALVLAACDEVDPGPDFTPIEDGMKFMGVALVVAVLVGVIGLARRGGRHG